MFGDEQLDGSESRRGAGPGSTPATSPALVLAIAVLAAIDIALDSRVPGTLPQHGLGVATALVLAGALRLSAPEERREALLCVVVSTAFELFATQVWGLYHYRFGNVPLYVPPGHGLVFLFAAHAARTPLLERHGRAFRGVVLALATAWAIGGLLRWGASAGARDGHGALYWPFFAGFVLFSRRFGGAFAATFVLTSGIELLGTALGTWHWASEVPGLGVPSADPPSVVAGGYCVFGLAASLLGQGIARSSAKKAAEKAAVTTT